MWLRFARIGGGFGLLVAGIAMLVLPGPGWVTIAAALAILAAEFAWARRMRDGLIRVATQIIRRVRRGTDSCPPMPPR